MMNGRLLISRNNYNSLYKINETKFWIYILYYLVKNREKALNRT